MGRWKKTDPALYALCSLLSALCPRPRPSHHRADTAIALLIAAVTPKARLRHRFDRLLDGAARAGRGQNPIDRGCNRRKHRGPPPDDHDSKAVKQRTLQRGQQISATLVYHQP